MLWKVGITAVLTFAITTFFNWINSEKDGERLFNEAFSHTIEIVWGVSVVVSICCAYIAIWSH